jgi:1-acyl-sn-glycerol-3-phosphate acyltransferase
MTDVKAYIARQDRVGWRRSIIRWLIRWIGFTLLARVRVQGLENIPASGPAIIMMNHISSLDPVVCMGAVTSRYVVPMTKIENLRVPGVNFFVRMWDAYTVDRDTLDRSALANSIELLRSGQLILIAPEGTRHPEGMVEPKEGVAFIASKADAVIIPTALSDGQHFKSYWKRLRRAQVRVTFGRPFRLKVGDGRITRDQRAEMMREAMYQIAIAQPDPTLRGIYSDIENATTGWLEFVDPASL